MTDRYLKIVLTVIAAALVYLCVVLTPLPGVSAQTNSRRPGEPSGPTEVVVVGWRSSANESVPVSIAEPVRVTASAPLPITAPQPLAVTGRVVTEQSRADEVVLVGWTSTTTVPAAHNLSSRPVPVTIGK